METIHMGWLTKSPLDRPWKILKPKWRRCYFVLCVSQASTTLPGQCPAILNYYDSEKQLHKKGTIDLNNCDEVRTRPDMPLYEHTFTLHTKYRDHQRTYCLAADSEDDMTRWVQCLCTVLQLDDGSETTNGSSLSVDSGNGAPFNERYVRVPQLPATPPILTSSTANITISHSSSTNSSPVSLMNDPYNPVSTLTDEDKSEAYIPLDECYSGTAKKSNAAAVHGIFPPVSTGLYLNTNSNLQAMVGNSQSDMRKPEYCNIFKEDGRETDVRHANAVGQAVPRSSFRLVYDYPSNIVHSRDQNKGALGQNQETSLPIKNGRARIAGTAAEEKARSSSSTRVQGSPATRSGTSSLSTDSLDRNHDLPSYININSTGTGTPANSVLKSSVHRYINADVFPPNSPSSACVMAPTYRGHPATSITAVASSPTHISNGRFIPSGFEGRKVVGGVATESVPVVVPGRSQSFKRSIACTEVPLPIKKCGQSEDSSSSDDGSDEDVSDKDRRNHHGQLPVHQLKKMSLDTYVQPPQLKDAIQYLDLNLEDSGIGADRSPALNRSIQQLASNETNYNEIDWIRTKALIETKKDLESERHNSERSVESCTHSP